jgi:acyl carrier protein
MTESEKIVLLEEMMELDVGTLSPQTYLSKISEWDSLAAISFMVLLNDFFKKTINGSQIKEFKTVADVLVVMNDD